MQPGDLINILFDDGHYYVQTRAEVKQDVADDVRLAEPDRYDVATPEFIAAHKAYVAARLNYVALIHTLPSCDNPEPATRLDGGRK